MAGRWAYRAVGSQLTEAAGLDPIHTRIISVLLVDQEQDGENLTYRGTYCDHTTEDPDALVHAVIPDTYRAVLEPVTRTGTITVGEDGLRYQLARFYEVVGATLQDPAQDALPETADDMRVLDQDQDGHPGMTLNLTGPFSGEVYVVERKWTEADGVAISADRIEGKLGFTSEQIVLASDPPSIKASVDAARTIPDAEACNSTFVMVRIPDDADCAWVNSQAESLFK